MSKNIDVVWSRIQGCAGEDFYQIRGQKFYYEVVDSVLNPSTTNQNLPKSQFEKALEFLPLANTIPVQHLRGPSYLFAVLMDDRIRKNDW